MNSNDRIEIYRYPQEGRNPKGCVLRLISIPGQRQYIGEQYKVDRLILIEIENSKGEKLNIAYPVEAQKAMWEAVFNVWVKPEKKAKYAHEFKMFIEQKLQQAKLF